MTDRFAVVGAGQMGNGIAHVCATSGFAVTLIDVSAEALVDALVDAEPAPALPRGPEPRRRWRGDR